MLVGLPAKGNSYKDTARSSGPLVDLCLAACLSVTDINVIPNEGDPPDGSQKKAEVDVAVLFSE